MYAGLTIADKPALLDAKAKGAEWVAREDSGALWGYSTKPENIDQFLGNFTWSVSGYDILEGSIEMDSDTCEFIKYNATEPVNIDLAIAQIAEMERAEKPLTWNERINQMTVEEKAAWSMNGWTQMHNDAANYAWEEPDAFIDRYEERMVELLNSPYAEGETK